MRTRKHKSKKGADIRGRLDEHEWARVRAFQKIHRKNDSAVVRDALESYLNAMELADARRAAELASLSIRPEIRPGNGVKPESKPELHVRSPRKAEGN